jgi:hypothetical protein
LNRLNLLTVSHTASEQFPDYILLVIERTIPLALPLAWCAGGDMIFTHGGTHTFRYFDTKLVHTKGQTLS